MKREGFPLEADYIVVGVGTAGSVLARRLADNGCSVIGLDTAIIETYFLGTTNSM